MVSMQPITQSYVEEPESCFITLKKSYTKGTIMDILMNESPLMAYIAQVALLDDILNSEEFKGTCFAPCESYCIKYFQEFKGKLDKLTAMNIVMGNLISVELTINDLFKNYQIIPVMNVNKTINVNKGKINDLTVLKSNVKCTNGIIHILNGIID